jgi:hypothetical protein
LQLKLRLRPQLVRVRSDEILQSAQARQDRTERQRRGDGEGDDRPEASEDA